MIEFLKESPLTQPLIFDSHAHYDDEKFDDCRDEILSALPLHGVGRIINCGCDAISSRKALSLAEKYDYIYAAVGIHPENLESNTDLSQISELSAHNKCVAIGEIGLDYYWVSDNKEQQKSIFEKQIILAKNLNLPIIVHDREAHADTLELLKKYKPKGVLHSFSGSIEMAEEILKIGMYIGIGGAVTFKNAKKLPEVAKMVPENRFLLETDCPYLTPVPYRSKLNHSGMIFFTAQKIAEIRETEIELVLKSSFSNAQKLFGL